MAEAIYQEELADDVRAELLGVLPHRLKQSKYSIDDVSVLDETGDDEDGWCVKIELLLFKEDR